MRVQAYSKLLHTLLGSRIATSMKCYAITD